MTTNKAELSNGAFYEKVRVVGSHSKNSSSKEQSPKDTAPLLLELADTRIIAAAVIKKVLLNSSVRLILRRSRNHRVSGNDFP